MTPTECPKSHETIERALARVSKPNEKARQEAMVRVLRELRPLLNGEPPEPTE